MSVFRDASFAGVVQVDAGNDVFARDFSVFSSASSRGVLTTVTSEIGFGGILCTSSDLDGRASFDRSVEVGNLSVGGSICTLADSDVFFEGSHLFLTMKDDLVSMRDKGLCAITKRTRIIYSRDSTVLDNMVVFRCDGQRNLQIRCVGSSGEMIFPGLVSLEGYFHNLVLLWMPGSMTGDETSPWSGKVLTGLYLLHEESTLSTIQLYSSRAEAIPDWLGRTSDWQQKISFLVDQTERNFPINEPFVYQESLFISFVKISHLKFTSDGILQHASGSVRSDFWDAAFDPYRNITPRYVEITQTNNTLDAETSVLAAGSPLTECIVQITNNHVAGRTFKIFNDHQSVSILLLLNDVTLDDSSTSVTLNPGENIIFAYLGSDMFQVL